MARYDTEPPPRIGTAVLLFDGLPQTSYLYIAFTMPQVDSSTGVIAVRT